MNEYEREQEAPLTTAEMAASRRSDDVDDELNEATPGAATDAPAEHGLSQSTTPLFVTEEAESYRQRWADVQTGFVDEPRQAVEHADELVAEVMQRLAEVFAEERAGLEAQWERGEDVSTENLRVTLQRYRAFFDRLLTV